MNEQVQALASSRQASGRLRWPIPHPLGAASAGLRLKADRRNRSNADIRRRLYQLLAYCTVLGLWRASVFVKGTSTCATSWRAGTILILARVPRTQAGQLAPAAGIMAR